jgi:hypothetical protein
MLSVSSEAKKKHKDPTKERKGDEMTSKKYTLYILTWRRCSLQKSRYARKHAGLACPIEEMIEREGGLQSVCDVSGFVDAFVT